MWQQNYEPVGGSLALSAVVAAIPIAVLFFMLGVWRKPSWLAALTALGCDPVAAAAALETYRGVGRRFELKGEAGGVTVIDDYAHHPTEVRATLRAARERYGDRRLWAVFQPHTFSRTRALLGAFAAALTLLSVWAFSMASQSARTLSIAGRSRPSIRARCSAGTSAAVTGRALSAVRSRASSAGRNRVSAVFAASNAASGAVARRLRSPATRASGLPGGSFEVAAARLPAAVFAATYTHPNRL